jgi:hypothetical protein
VTRSEALSILEVTEPASQADVTRRYQQLFSENQILVMNAPTPEMRRMFDEHLRRIESACEALYPGLTVSRDRRGDLPAFTPVPTTDFVRGAEVIHPRSDIQNREAEKKTNKSKRFVANRWIVIPLVLLICGWILWQLHWLSKASGVYAALPIGTGDRITRNNIHIVAKNGDQNSPTTGLPLDPAYYEGSEACAVKSITVGEEISEASIAACETVR